MNNIINNMKQVNFNECIYDKTIINITFNSNNNNIKL